MKIETITTTPDQARALLKTDELNRVTRLVKRGGLLSEAHRKRLKRIIAGDRTTPKTPKAKIQEITSTDPKSFEGTFKQRLRRAKIYRMRMCGRSIDEMATEIDASNKTIVEDLKAIDAALHRTIDRTQADAILNERLSNLESMRLMCLESAEESEGNERIGYFNTATKLEDQIAKLLQDAGVIKRVHRHELTGADGAPLPAAASIAAEIRVTVAAEGEAKQQGEKIIRLQSKAA